VRFVRSLPGGPLSCRQTTTDPMPSPTTVHSYLGFASGSAANEAVGAAHRRADFGAQHANGT
jgi:hypothetical protein